MTAQNDIDTRLAELLEVIKDADQRQVGYPTNQIFDYSALIPFLSYSINNVGDPFHQTNYRANTHEFEREVILHFAKLTGLDPDSDHPRQRQLTPHSKNVENQQGVKIRPGEKAATRVRQ